MVYGEQQTFAFPLRTTDWNDLQMSSTMPITLDDVTNVEGLMFDP